MRRCIRWDTMTALAAMVIVTVSAIPSAARAEDLFSDTVGPVPVAPVKTKPALEVPFITWGGDVATFHANGGLQTRKGSIYDQMGLKLALRAGDDFIGQVRRYLAGETPFLRGTMRMLGQASEVIGRDPRTRPVVFLQLTWSKGDHLVGRAAMKTLDDLKGKTIAIQRGGPHVGMLDDALRSVRLTWNDVKIVWCDELTGPGSPADRFRNDESIDACTVITPDMLGLSGGVDEAGSGAEGTVKGARVVVSTQSMSRSIADVYAVRKDWYDANRATVEKLTAGYLKGVDALVKMRREYDETGAGDEYESILTMAQKIFGEDVIPTIEVDGHGLLLDAAFVGLAGNENFFEAKGNLNGFDPKEDVALDLAVRLGYAKERSGMLAPTFRWERIREIGGLERVVAESSGVPDAPMHPDVIFEFDINFAANEQDFDIDDYGQDFMRTVESASTFGGAVIVIEGHADPAKMIGTLVRAGFANGVLKRTGNSGNYTYYYKGEVFDLSNTVKLTELIEQGAFAHREHDARKLMIAALNLSQRRAEAVKQAIVTFAGGRGLQLNADQLRPLGLGVMDPIIPVPRNDQDAAVNRRVVFSIKRVSSEATSPSDFDF